MNICHIKGIIFVVGSAMRFFRMHNGEMFLFLLNHLFQVLDIHRDMFWCLNYNMPKNVKALIKWCVWITLILFELSHSIFCNHVKYHQWHLRLRGRFEDLMHLIFCICWLWNFSLVHKAALLTTSFFQMGLYMASNYCYDHLSNMYGLIITENWMKMRLW